MTVLTRCVQCGLIQNSEYGIGLRFVRDTPMFECPCGASLIKEDRDECLELPELEAVEAQERINERMYYQRVN